jgi:uncharacterized protein YjbI with pentapeptide repeats
VPFNLQNSPRKYSGFRNKYCYKTNIHNLIYKDGYFENVKYQASNITECNYKNCTMIGMDFVGCNLKGTDFSGAKLTDVIFLNCKLDKARFTRCYFHNVYFIMTDISRCIDLSDDFEYLNKYTKVEITVELQEALVRLCNNEESYKYHVLHVNKKKANMWMVKILTDRYGAGTGKALLAFSKREDLKRLYTLHSYAKFIEKYLKI